MSFQDMAWAIEQECDSPGQKLVLLMLANHCNGHTRRCDPSHKLLAKECSMGVSTLKRNILSLVDAGLLEIIHRAVEGVSLPNQYKLLSKSDGVGPNRTEGGPKSDGGVGPNRATNQEVKPGIEPISAIASSAAKLPTCQADEIVNLYHDILPEMPAVRLMTEARKKALKSFWAFVLTSKKSDGTSRASDAETALAWTGAYFQRARDNDFLMGRGTKASGHEGWACSLDFLLSEKGRIQVIEKTKDAS